MYIDLFVGIACAILFYRMADYERIGPLGWTVASLGATIFVGVRGGGIILLLLLQVVLFLLMWGYNVRRKQQKR